MNTKRFFAFLPGLIVCLFYAQVHSQQLFRSEEIPVKIDGNFLQNAWAGGLNSCQFSSVDLNDDGKNDLFVFDRIGDRVLCFLNQGETGEINYNHDFSYTLEFPDSLENWALMRDYNCDGRNDIFTNYSSGLRLYENESTSADVEFTLRSVLPEAQYDFSGTPFSAPLYCIGVDLPGICDYDEDGDMDIFSFTETSMTVYYYKNRAVEIGECDSLAYICGNRCYGKFSESPESFTIYKGEEAECDFNVIDPRDGDSHGPLRHTGGTLVNLDLDQNGVKDLVIGDVTESYLLALEMDNLSDNTDSATVCNENFPQQYLSALPIELLFPGVFYEDVNNDGVRDIISSPNAFSSAQDSSGCWMYINEGEDDLPDLHLNTKGFLQHTMIDLGTGAMPVLADISGDGLADLILANQGYYSDLDFTSKLWYFRNTGTSEDPLFELWNNNYLDIPSHEWHSVYPAFSDLDDDGDIDLILGEQEGTLHYFENTAGPGAEAVFVLTESPVEDSNTIPIDIGQFAAPQLIDINDDGIEDLLVGEKNGNINYFENVGSVSEYSFTLQEDTLGGVVATNFLGVNGYSVPHFFYNQDDELELLVGSETGQINQYTEITGNLENDFTLNTLDYHNIWEGDRSAVFTSDINGDDKTDLFLGQIGGGVAFYSGDTAEINITELDPFRQFSLYPNPSSGLLNIHFSELSGTRRMAEIFDLTGRKLAAYIIQPWNRECTLDISNFSAGTYLLICEGQAGRFVKL